MYISELTYGPLSDAVLILSDVTICPLEKNLSIESLLISILYGQAISIIKVYGYTDMFFLLFIQRETTL